MRGRDSRGGTVITAGAIAAVTAAVACSALAGCAAASDRPDGSPTPGATVAAFYGDSYTRGTGADEPERRWSSIGDDLERFREELADARLVVVEPFWYTAERPDSLERIIEWVEEAAERVGADHVDGASRWLEGHPEWIAADGIHPNDEGHAEIARRMDEELERLVR
ncbi:hypothetical protein [Agromyces sp. H66]|uniref:SGNH/GDSL hydrolase family protein n=1 Tax=Agromyces sp. H66 TaxID=2529859 RepID=UPI0010A9C13C|nr:hypothetical protein [Agromyces sp. H66]